MDFLEATQVLRDEAPSKNNEDATRVGTLKVGSKVYTIRRGFNRIGRVAQCTVVIDDTSVSKVHAEIQAGDEGAFISDLRSLNGTKIKDVELKPFYYYSINDGDAIYFGQTKAVYSTTRPTETNDVLLAPETPVTPRNCSATERNTSEYFVRDSSVSERDTSPIPGTQQRNRSTFQNPPTPLPCSPSSREVEESPNGSKSRDALRKSDNDETTIRNDTEASFQPPGAKRSRLGHPNTPNNESNIDEAATQAISSPIDERKDTSQPQNSGDIFEAETQIVAMSEKQKNRNDIFEAETRVLPVALGKNKNFEKWKNQDDIFEAETQALPVAMSKKRKIVDRSNRDDIFNDEIQASMEVTTSRESNSIFEAETQAMEIPVPKSDEKIAKLPVVPVVEAKNRTSSELETNGIHEAETQKVKEQSASYVSVEPIGMQRNIDDLATQILDAKNKASTVGSSGRLNETVESSYRSNSSRDRLRLSSTPPTSPEDVNIEESQNLLEIAPTPLLAYEKRCEKIPPIEVVSVAVEESKIGEKKCRGSRIISESSESETDDEKVSPRFVRKSKPSSIIEDSSEEEPTDEENIFGGCSMARAGVHGISSSEARGSPLLRSHENDEGVSNGDEKKNVSISGVTGTSRVENLPTKIEDASTRKFGRSSLHLPSTGDRVSPEKNERQASERGGAKSKDNGSALKNQGGSPEGVNDSKKIGDSPINREQSLGRAKKKEKIGDSSKNQQESSEGSINSEIFEDSPERANDSPGKIRAKKSSRFERRSNISSRPSLRLSRKANVLASKRTVKKSTNEEAELDIFAVATQRVVYDSDVDTSPTREVDQREGPATRNNEIDIDLLPTQILEVPSSTPLFRKSGYRKIRARQEELDVDDLHSAPTQILKESPSGQNTDDRKQLGGKDVRGTPIRIPMKSPRMGNVDGDRDKTNDEGKTIDLDDSLATNLGNLLGEEAANDCLDDEGTQLMTQNLVDILRPTQSFSEETSNRKSSPRTSADNFGQASSIPTRKKYDAPETIGSVVREDRKSSRELFSDDPSPIKPVGGNKEIAQQSAHLDDDDEIFFGLPEVKICGTLSYPGSPSSSISSLADSLPPTKRPRNLSSNVGPTNRSDSSDSSDSPITPITPKESRLKNRSASSYKIVKDALDDDSEEDFDYQDLKRMADRLLASDSRCEGNSRRTTTRTTRRTTRRTTLVDKFAKIPVPIVRKKIGEPKGRAVKLPGGPSHSSVSDSKDESSSIGSSDSSAGTKKSRRSKTQAKAAAASVVAVDVPLRCMEEGGKESQEVETILVNAAVEENRPMLSRKSYAKMKIATRNVEKEKRENSVAEAPPKPTRKRRTVLGSGKSVEKPIVTPSRSRRTISGTPGIPGDVEDRRILFTGVKDEKYDRIVEKLGGTVVSDPSEATVLITDKVRRTFKFLCAVARGIRVVSINWLHESNRSLRFLDCERFVLKDTAAEAKYKFALEKSLRIARTNKLLDGYTVIVTPKVNQPEIRELKGMVETCGGRLLIRPGRNWSAKTVIISREEDYAEAKAYLAKSPKNLKITVQSTEFILTGILRQEINLVEHELKFA